MSGVFGAGALASFAKLNFYPSIKAIYAVSTGAFNAVYFLTRQVELDSSIYFEDLGSNFISYKNFFAGFCQRVFYGLRNRHPAYPIDALNVDF